MPVWVKNRSSWLVIGGVRAWGGRPRAAGPRYIGMPRSTVTRGEPENRKTEGRGYAACVASGRNDSSSLGRLNRGSNLPESRDKGPKEPRRRLHVQRGPL